MSKKAKKTKTAKNLKEYLISSRVTGSGIQTSIVHASSPEEAADIYADGGGDFEDIQWDSIEDSDDSIQVEENI